MKKALFSLLFVTILAVVGLSLVIVDDIGRMVEISEAPSRVIVAAPAVTGYLKTLGLQDKIVGVTDWDPYAFESNVEKIGNLVPLNLEKILLLEPDIVFLMGGFQEPEVKKLENIGITAVVINANSIEDIYRDIVLIASIFGINDKGKNIAANFRSRVLQIAKKAYSIPQEKRPKVFLAMVSSEINEIWTCGTGSYLNQIIAYAGGVNVAAPYTGNNGWFPVSPEFVLKTSPDVILVPYYYEGGQEEAVNKILNYKPFASVPAVENKRVYPVDGNLMSYANPDIIILLEQLHQLFYGE